MVLVGEALAGMWVSVALDRALLRPVLGTGLPGAGVRAAASAAVNAACLTWAPLSVAAGVFVGTRTWLSPW